MPLDTDFPCTFCDYKSKYRNCVKRHIKLKHEKVRDSPSNKTESEDEKSAEKMRKDITDFQETNHYKGE